MRIITLPILSVFLLLYVGCLGQQNPTNEASSYTEVKAEDYVLYQAQPSKAVLVLFPCFPCNATNTQTEFDIVEEATEEGVSVLMMDFNRRLYLNDEEKASLVMQLERALTSHGLNDSQLVFGGFSSGGNVALLAGDYLTAKTDLKLKGVFVVDSPIDLLALYNTSVYHLEHNQDERALEEPRFLKQYFEQTFGAPSTSIKSYEQFSPYTYQTQYIGNIAHLAKTPLRFYTEPDVDWWKSERNANYEHMNAYYLEQLHNTLSVRWPDNTVELMLTKDKGYRANGMRHPHSWSIVDKNDLIHWINSITK
ncbi:MAG: hypothetical protein AAFX87_20190 [Bacteroidota bacterium]